MANVVVVGAQWGDEGKGKIVDWLSEQADIVVRFQGGHNAGHTLVINGKTYKLALLPSGVVRPSKLSVIGNGVVFDPQAFVTEVGRLKEQGVTVSPDNLRVAENVTLILPLHRELDAAREEAGSLLRIGTTKRGIGPAYEDKVARRALRFGDLFDKKRLTKTEIEVSELHQAINADSKLFHALSAFLVSTQVKTHSMFSCPLSIFKIQFEKYYQTELKECPVFSDNDYINLFNLNVLPGKPKIKNMSVIYPKSCDVIFLKSQKTNSKLYDEPFIIGLDINPLFPTILNIKYKDVNRGNTELASKKKKTNSNVLN